LNRTFTYKQLSSTLWLIQSTILPWISRYFLRRSSFRFLIRFAKSRRSFAVMGFTVTPATRTVLDSFATNYLLRLQFIEFTVRRDRGSIPEVPNRKYPP